MHLKRVQNSIQYRILFISTEIYSLVLRSVYDCHRTVCVFVTLAMSLPVSSIGQSTTSVGGGRKVGRFGVRIGVRMFSMEDRRRVVDLYFTEGMTIRKVVAELGYPSEGALGEMGSRGSALHGRV